MVYSPKEAVITTQSIIEGEKITHAYCDCDKEHGDFFWEFLPDKDWNYGDLRLVAMEEIILKDSRLLNVINNLIENQAAIFDSNQDKWIIVPYDYSSSR